MTDQIVFTNHARERMSLRRISEQDIRSVLTKPDATYPEEKPETTKFIRTLRDRKIQVIARHLPDQKKTLVISVWVRGEEDPTPLLWLLLSLPFRALWWLLRSLWNLLFSKKSTS